MTTGIYCYYDNLRCEIVYVGKDSHIDKNARHKAHYRPSERKKQDINKVLQNDNKSGRYSYAVLEQGNFTIDELNQKEISWIAFFNPKFCFTEGGDGASRGEKHHFYGIKLSKEHCEKISKALTGIKRSKETCEKMSKNNARYWKNKKRPKETCEKMSKNNARYWKNKKRPKEFCEKISKALTGINNSQFNPCIKITQTPCETCKQGFTWIAQPYTPKKRENFQSVDLQKCIEKVENFIKSNDNVYGYTDFEIKKIEGD